MLLVWFISCQILSWIWKRLKASVLPTPLTRNEQKHLPKAAQQRDSAPITNTGYLKLQRAISSTLSLLLMAFPPTTTTPNTWGNTTFFNHTPVASQCILIAADWNSTAHITCQRTDMTWSQDTCILCGITHSLAEQKTEASAYMQSPEQLHEGWNEALQRKTL